jgi:hypothetical protein
MGPFYFRELLLLLGSYSGALCSYLLLPESSFTFFTFRELQRGGGQLPAAPGV